jgi:hypothetical protein
MSNYTTNYNLKKPLGTDNYNIEDQNGNMDIIDSTLKTQSTQIKESSNILTPTTGSTANAILLNISPFSDYKKYSFKATSASTGNVTINGKVFKKLDGTQIGNGGVKANKVYDFYYDSTSDCVFILAKAEGDSTDADVLAGKIYSNGDDIGRTGSMTNNNIPSTSLPINGSYTIPKGYHPGTEIVTQSIPTKAAATITPGTTDQTIASNQYLSGVQTIKGEPNLLAANIVSGISLFNIVGAATIASLGGTNYATNSQMPNVSATYTLTFSPNLIVVYRNTSDWVLYYKGSCWRVTNGNSVSTSSSISVSGNNLTIGSIYNDTTAMVWHAFKI